MEQTYARARELCQQAGETPQLLQVLFGSWQFYLVRGELHIARELGERYLNLAQRQDDSASLLMAQWALGMTLFYLGEFVPAQDHTERSLVLYNTQPPSPIPSSTAGPWEWLPGPCGPGSVDAWLSRDQAQHRSDAALTLARKLSHPYSVVFALNQAVVLHQLRREGHAACERAEAVMSFCLEQGITQQ